MSARGYATKFSLLPRGAIFRAGADSINPIGISGTEDIYWWGDSLTLGAAEKLRPIYGSVVNKGIGGETSTQIRARFFAPLGTGDIVVLWPGNNNPDPPATALADLAAMVASAGSRYLVMGLLINSIHAGGDATKTAVLNYNSSAATIYGNNFLNILDYLKTQYDPENPQDVTDVANGITPSSLRVDEIHLNATGYGLVAAKVKAKLIQLGYLPDPATTLSLAGIVGNCLTSSGTSGLLLSVESPVSAPALSTISKIENGGTAVVAYTAGDTLNVTTNGTIFNLRITFQDGSVVKFPCNEGGGSVLYGYRVSDGAIYKAYLGGNATTGGTMSTIWVGAQNLYHHAVKHGSGTIAAGTLSGERLFRAGEHDFSAAGNWSLSPGWSLSGGKALHTGTSGTFLAMNGRNVQGDTMRCTFDIPEWGGALIGLGGAVLTGGYYVGAAGSYSKDYTALGFAISFYCTSDATTVDNVSLKSVFQADTRCPANPVTGLDCRGNTKTSKPGWNSSAKYALPASSALLAADDGTFFDVSDIPIAKTLAELLALQGDQFFFSLTHGRPVIFAIYAAPLTGTNLTRADRYFGFA